MADRIRLAGMIFYGFHGVGPEEQQVGQRFVVDLDVERDLRAAGLSDEPGDTVNYAQMYRVVKEIVEGPSRKLLESVAESIAEAILDGFGRGVRDGDRKEARGAHQGQHTLPRRRGDSPKAIGRRSGEESELYASLS